jgi:hypothetical protein
VYLHFSRAESASASPSQENIRKRCQGEQEATECPVDVLEEIAVGQIWRTYSGVGLPKVDRMLFETRFLGDR